ncbi:MAG: response regulator transcription factor [Verrucomicrobiae bacterium]|nr:response regulator transcription factor [Verrucomicrobiae bacterium]
MISIILADDHQVIRQKLKRLLAQEPAWRVGAETDDGLEAVRLVGIAARRAGSRSRPAGSAWLQVTRRVHRQSTRTRIVIVSIHDDEQYVRQALLNGALGYVAKDQVGRHLVPPFAPPSPAIATWDRQWGKRSSALPDVTLKARAEDPRALPIFPKTPNDR